MKTPRRGRPPKPPADVRTVRVTVLLTEREHATLLRACGGRGVATLMREAGLRETELAATDEELARWRAAAAAAGVSLHELVRDTMRLMHPKPRAVPIRKMGS